MKGIETQHIFKKFNRIKALEDVSLTFEHGKIYGLLGRNGAGKSTLLNIISNRIYADQGEVWIDGELARENDKVQQLIYCTTDKEYYPSGMRMKEIFYWTNEFYGKFDVETSHRLSEEFGLDVRKKVEELSTGYRSIFKIVIALSLDVPYVLLDEPVLGLDAVHREHFYKSLLVAYGANPRTFVISTHLIEEVSKLIEEVVLIKSGRMVCCDTTENLLQSGYTVSGAASVVDQFVSDKQVIGVDVLGGLKSVSIIGALNQNEIPDGLEVTRLDLQKWFVQLTKE